MSHPVRAVAVGPVVSVGLIHASVSTRAAAQISTEEGINGRKIAGGLVGKSPQSAVRRNISSCLEGDISVSTPSAIKFFLAAALIFAFSFTATFARAEEPPRPGCIKEEEGLEQGIGALAAALMGYEVVETEESVWLGHYDEHGRPKYEPRKTSWYCPPPATQTSSTWGGPTVGFTSSTSGGATGGFSLVVSGGAVSAATPTSNQANGSPDPDPNTTNKVTPTGTGAAVGVGWVYTIQPAAPTLPTEATYRHRYAPEDKPASGFPAVLPAKAPPKPVPPVPRVTFGVEGNVYAFAGVNSTIHGIPGGPFGTATGNDSFNIKDKYLFTGGAFLKVPITATWSAALTGGVALVDKQVTYNCFTYCAVAPATPSFSNSQDVWLPGAYVGGRIQMPLAIAAWPGTTLGFDYKHVFLASQNVTVGNVTTRWVTLNVAQDIDLFTATLAIPLR